MEGANPHKKMRATSENLLKPSKNLFPGTKNQNPRKNCAQISPFVEQTSGVATPQPSGSNPDRSPVAQWLNMRISPASCLPGPASQLPGLCLPASASRGPLQTRAQPGVGGKPRAAGKVFRNHNTGRNSPTFKKLGRPGVGGKPRAAGKVFRNHNIGPNSPPFQTLARPGVDTSPGRGEGFQK